MDTDTERISSILHLKGHFDTTLFIIREVYDANYINEEWVKDYGIRVLWKYNEDGLATSHIGQECNLQTGEYETKVKTEFVCNESNIHVETYMYNYLGDDTWKLMNKFIDIQYAEWYPNGQP